VKAKYVSSWVNVCRPGSVIAELSEDKVFRKALVDSRNDNGGGFLREGLKGPVTVCIFDVLGFISEDRRGF